MTLNNTTNCWVMTDGKPGMENQCLGLAEALDLVPEIKRIAPRAPWTWLPPQLWLAPLAAPGPNGDPVAPPWPDLLIASGRRTVALARAIKRASGGRTFAVQIQNPAFDTGGFDLIAVPEHDQLSGANVITTLGALHRVTAARTLEAADRFSSQLQHLPRPWVAVLIGGTNAQYRMTRAATARLADGLSRLAREHSAGLMITASRRTGAENQALLAERLSGDGVAIWDGAGENPYFAYLGLADALVVTCDSVSMISEACATGKPVYVFHLEGGSTKFGRFHDRMVDAGITRPFSGELESWTYDPPRDVELVAAAVRQRMGQSAATAASGSEGN